MSEKWEKFSSFMRKIFCYCCEACEGNNPKCIAFVFKYGEKIDSWPQEKIRRKFERFHGKYESGKKEIR